MSSVYGGDVFSVSPLDATFTGTYDDVSGLLADRRRGARRGGVPSRRARADVPPRERHRGRRRRRLPGGRRSRARGLLGDAAPYVERAHAAGAHVLLQGGVGR